MPTTQQQHLTVEGVLEKLQGKNHFSEGLSFFNVSEASLADFRRVIANQAAEAGRKAGEVQVRGVYASLYNNEIEVVYFCTYLPGLPGYMRWYIRFPYGDRAHDVQLVQTGEGYDRSDLSDCEMRHECYCDTPDNDTEDDDWNEPDDCGVCYNGEGWCIRHNSSHR